MSQVYETETRASGASAGAYDQEGSGWVAFAGVMILIVGSLNVIYGIAAIDKSTFYVQDAKYIVNDLNGWGWFLLVVGAVQCCAGFGIWARAGWARWVGILSASVNAILQLLFIPASPFLALALFAVDILIIYGLVAHGHRQRA
jgi:hypothetical protein